nr:hypothetical protein [Tanacetum cinerariifolium]
MEGRMTDRYPLRKRKPMKQPKSKKRTRNAAVGQECQSMYRKHSKGARSPRIPNYNEWKVAEWPENHSSNDETVDEHPIVSHPDPPSTSGGSITRDVTVSTFISKIKEAQDSSVMGSLASGAFKFFDDIGIDYKPLKEAVSSLISHQLKKESLERQKPQWAFETKALRDASIAEVCKYKEKKSHVDSKYKDVQHRYDAITARYDHLKEELKNVEDEKVKCEGERAVTQAEKVETDKLYCTADLKRTIREVGVPEAQVIIKEWETPYNESVDSVNLAKDKFSHLAM